MSEATRAEVIIVGLGFIALIFVLIWIVMLLTTLRRYREHRRMTSRQLSDRINDLTAHHRFPVDQQATETFWPITHAADIEDTQPDRSEFIVSFEVKAKTAEIPVVKDLNKKHKKIDEASQPSAESVVKLLKAASESKAATVS